MSNKYRVVFLGNEWSLTVFVDVTDADLVGLPLRGTVADGLFIDGTAINKADKFIQDECGVRPAEFAYDVEVEHWAHAKA